MTSNGLQARWLCALAGAVILLAGCGQQPAGETAANPDTGNAAASADASNAGPQPDSADSERSGGNSNASNGGSAEESADSVSACLRQDGERVAEMNLHAIGTEPFWAADVKGRCVIYSTPENQAGTRVWTQFSGTGENGRWTGALGGEQFVMTTRPKPDCSDGMSDKRYPIAVTLQVRGEERRGCAERRS